MRKPFYRCLLFISIWLAFQPSVFAAVTFEENPKLAQDLLLPIYEWHDATVPSKGVVFLLQGLTFYAKAFDHFASYLASEGYDTYALDFRGFGVWKTNPEKFYGDNLVHFSQSKEDMLKALAKIRQERPNEKVFCLGESLGANYGLWLVANNPNLVDGAIMIGPCVKRYLHPRLRWPADVLKGLIHPKHGLNLVPYINPYLSEDQSVTKRCLQDPNICRKLSPVDLIKTNITNKDSLKQIKNIPADMPILIIAGEKDRVFKTPVLPTFITKLGSKKVTLKIIAGRGHLLVESQPVNPVVAKVIHNWLDENNKTSEKVGHVP